MLYNYFAASCSSDHKIDKFGRICQCSSNSTPHSCCRYRQNWSSLSAIQRNRYISAVLTVSSDPKYAPLYQKLIRKYENSFSSLAQSTVPGISQFVPWHRYFLLEYEDLLRLVHRDITIPYWDWSVSTSKPYSLPVFDPIAGFGNTSKPETGCVSSGPFREGKFEVTYRNGSTSCLVRKYENFKFFDRAILERSLSLGTDNFREFHNFMQLFLTLNIRCFIGGQMCSSAAANDPLYLLHLTRVDLFVQKWQERDPNNLPVQQSNRGDSLVETFDESLRVFDFCANDKLPYETCVSYEPLDPVRERQKDLSGGDVLLCAPMGRLTDEGLSDQARRYLSRVCDNT